LLLATLLRYLAKWLLVLTEFRVHSVGQSVRC